MVVGAVRVVAAARSCWAPCRQWGLLQDPRRPCLCLLYDSLLASTWFHGHGCVFGRGCMASCMMPLYEETTSLVYVSTRFTAQQLQQAVACILVCLIRSGGSFAFRTPRIRMGMYRPGSSTHICQRLRWLDGRLRSMLSACSILKGVLM
jgi:hypothetical protein